MSLGKAANIMSRIAEPVAKGISWIGVATLFAMMLLTSTDVTLRYVFNKPIAGSMELTEVFMAVVVGLGLSYCALQKGHVRVDIVTSRLSSRGQIVTDSIAHLVFLAFFILVTWRTLLRALTMMTQHLMTQVLFIPVPPFALMVTVGCAVLCLVLLRDFIDDLYRMVKK